MISDLKADLVKTILSFNKRGWSLATSTNYSYRENSEKIIISRSGVDKEFFTVEDLIQIDYQGKVLGTGHRSSAETEIHLALYQNPKINCVLHTHSPLATLLSMEYFDQGFIYFAGLELLKGVEGQSTHLTEVKIPIFDNSQDMKDINQKLIPYLQQYPDTVAFLIKGHGLYAWGKNIFDAKRHIETFEFLFQYQMNANMLARRD